MCTIKVTNIRGEVKGAIGRRFYCVPSVAIIITPHARGKYHHVKHMQPHGHTHRLVNKPVEYVVYCFPNKCSMTQKSTIDLVQDGLEEISDESAARRNANKQANKQIACE